MRVFGFHQRDLCFRFDLAFAISIRTHLRMAKFPRVWALNALLALLLGCVAGFSSFDELDLTALPAHPRLVATNAHVQRAKQFIETDPIAQEIFHLLQQEGLKILTQPPVQPPTPKHETGILTTARIVSCIKLHYAALSCMLCVCVCVCVCLDGCCVSG